MRRLIGAVLLVTLGVGCGPSSVPGDTLVVASPHRAEIREEFEHAFRPWYRQRTGRDVDVVWLDLGGTSEIFKYVTARLKSGGRTADVDCIFGGGTDRFISLADAGLCLPYRLPADLAPRFPLTLRGVPLRDEQGRWYGAALSAFGIVYNKPICRRLGLAPPRTWADLGRAPMFSWVGAGDPRLSGSVHQVYEIILQAHGWRDGFALLTRIGGGARSFTRHSFAIVRDVNTGEVAAGFCIDFYAGSLIAREGRDKIGFVLPTGQTPISADSICLVKGAPHPAVAQAFMEFVLRPVGQKLWMLKPGADGGPVRYPLGRYAVLPELYRLPVDQLAVSGDPFKMTAFMDCDHHKGGARWTVLNDLLGAVLIDSHEELRDAWRAVIDAGTPPDLVAELGRAPCTESELTAVAKAVGKDPRLRNARITAWTNWARRRYDRIRHQARRRSEDSARGLWHSRPRLCPPIACFATAQSGAAVPQGCAHRAR